MTTNEPKFPAIPDPGMSQEELLATVKALKEAVELLTGSRANGAVKAVKFNELSRYLGVTRNDLGANALPGGDFSVLGRANQLLKQAKIELTEGYEAGDVVLAGQISNLSVEIGDAQAAIEQEAITRASETSALAGTITTVQAQLDDTSAFGYYRLVAVATSMDGVAAEFEVRVSANGEDFSSAGLRLQVLGTGESRVLIDAGQFGVNVGNGYLNLSESLLTTAVYSNPGSGGDASALFRIAAETPPSGVGASIGLEVRATSDEVFAEAGLYLDADVDDLEGFSRIRLSAENVVIAQPDGSGAVQAHLLVAPGSPINTPITSGMITPNLGLRALSYYTLVTSNAEFQFPEGGWEGREWTHILEFDGTGGQTITQNDDSYLPPGPTITNTPGSIVVLKGGIIQAGGRPWAYLANAAAGTISDLPAPVNFNGSTWLHKTTALTGVADSSYFTLSFWVKRASDGAVQYVLNGQSSTFANRYLRIFIDDINRVQIRATDAGGEGERFVVFSSTNSILAANGWHHVLFSVNFSGNVFNNTSARYHLYINDTRDTNLQIFDDAAAGLDLTLDTWSVGQQTNNSSRLNGDLFDLWWARGSSVFQDFRTEANRRKFVSSTGKPVDLGESGELPGLGNPPLYFSRRKAADAASTFGTNRGTGGSFTTNGTLGDSSSSPYS